MSHWATHSSALLATLDFVSGTRTETGGPKPLGANEAPNSSLKNCSRHSDQLQLLGCYRMASVLASVHSSTNDAVSTPTDSDWFEMEPRVRDQENFNLNPPSVCGLPVPFPLALPWITLSSIISS